MATPFLKIYEAFLARITADEWTEEQDREIVMQDWQQLLQIGLFQFKYPKVSLLTSDNSFVEELGNDEIQLLALYMKHEWIKRCIASWQNIRQLYTDRDFSQANHLDKLIKLEETVALEVKRAEGKYNKRTAYKPSSKFSELAGKNNG